MYALHRIIAALPGREVSGADLGRFALYHRERAEVERLDRGARRHAGPSYFRNHRTRERLRWQRLLRCLGSELRFDVEADPRSDRPQIRKPRDARAVNRLLVWEASRVVRARPNTPDVVTRKLGVRE